MDITYSIEKNEGDALGKLTDNHITFKFSRGRVSLHISHTLMLRYSEPKIFGAREIALCLSVMGNLRGVTYLSSVYFVDEYSRLNFDVEEDKSEEKCKEIFEFLQTQLSK